MKLNNLANKVLIFIFINLTLIILFFPYKKLERTIEDEKTIICYNPISKICVTMTLEMKIEFNENEIIEYYELKTKGAGHINIFNTYNKNYTEHTYYVCYGLSSIYLSDNINEDYITDDISPFTIVFGYLFNNNTFSKKVVPIE